MWENAGDPKPDPDEKELNSEPKHESIMKTPDGEVIILEEPWIRRTHRSHKPYGLEVDKNFKDLFIEIWKNERINKETGEKKNIDTW